MQLGACQVKKVFKQLRAQNHFQINFQRTSSHIYFCPYMKDSSFPLNNTVTGKSKHITAGTLASNVFVNLPTTQICPFCSNDH